jgi:hypothetical protein
MTIRVAVDAETPLAVPTIRTRGLRLCVRLV